MASFGRLTHWCRIVLLGCGLGLLLALLYLSLVEYWSAGRLARGEPFQLSGAAARSELTRVIDSQLSAFQRADFAGAYDYAAEDFKQHVTSVALEQIVRQNYPGMLHSQGVNYGVALDNGSVAFVIVVLKGVSGRLHHYQYFLIREPAGWRINGVVQVNLPGTFI